MNDYKNKKRNLIERLKSGPVICAEGFLFEIEKRGYMASGEFVPMVSLDHPEALENLHRDFQHAGSDIVEAFTYNGHREKMRVIGKEKMLEPLNRAALKIAKKVATNPIEGTEPNLMAGNINNSNIWKENDSKSHLEVEKMFSEMVSWAVEEGADMLIGETFYYAKEAYKALKVMKKTGLPCVLTVSPMGENIMRDGISVVDTCKELEQLGADYAVDHRKDDWHKEVRGITKEIAKETGVSPGIDISFDHIGQTHWNKQLTLLKYGATLVSCGATTGYDAKTDLRHVFFKGTNILGSTQGTKAELEQGLYWMGQGKIKAAIDSTWSFEQAAEAHTKMLTGKGLFGKILIKPEGA